ncbi:MAG: hypothetical protein K2M91_00800 [Lachnospiraceae bacterium]|nr:hypothetical protein [Lachnospiraceae bacterium]
MSSLRVVLPSGTVASVDYVKPITERIIKFNGSRRRFIEYAKNMKDEANGVCITKEPSQGFGMCMNDNNIIVGNLSNEQVQEIIRQINEKGYYDFSQFKEYQKINALKDLKIGSEYPPYTSEGYIMLGAGLSGNPFGGCSFPMAAPNMDEGIFSSSSDYEDIGDNEEGDESEEN